MCQLGSDIAFLTVDGAERIACVTVRLLQDVITSPLCHVSPDAGCMAQYTVMLLYSAYLGPQQTIS